MPNSKSKKRNRQKNAAAKSAKQRRRTSEYQRKRNITRNQPTTSQTGDDNDTVVSSYDAMSANRRKSASRAKVKRNDDANAAGTADDTDDGEIIHKVKYVFTKGAKVLMALFTIFVVVCVISIAFAINYLNEQEAANKANIEANTASSSLITTEQSHSDDPNATVRIAGISRAGFETLDDMGKFDNVIVLDEATGLNAQQVYSTHVSIENAADIYRIRKQNDEEWLVRHADDDVDDASDDDDGNGNENASSDDTNENVNDTDADSGNSNENEASILDAKSRVDAARNAVDENSAE